MSGDDATKPAEPDGINLRQLRESLGIGQSDLAIRLGITQAAVSRLERKPDAYVGTVRKLVEAMGGTLDVVARFPDRPPVRLEWGGEAEPVADQPTK